ncbi:MAG: SDR family oxidoreductase [Actinobacteria bacterium]|nr:SDR family oxidoreductase [Actinomycetota bacterium]
MELGIAGKVALIFGAGGGLGSAIARTLAREGATVVLADSDASSLAAVAASIRGSAGRAQEIVWDLADIDSIKGHVAGIESTVGPVDILLNNTGGPPPTRAAGQDVVLWRNNFEQMVLSVIAITDRVLPGMRAHGWGRVITSTSPGVIAPIPNLGISNALRLALVGWSKTLSREVAIDGVTANVILPGRIATDRIRFLDEQKAKREQRALEDVIRESTDSIPAGRYGKPEEYGDVVAFLASDRAAYITGSVIRVDGGYVSSI